MWSHLNPQLTKTTRSQRSNGRTHTSIYLGVYLGRERRGNTDELLISTAEKITTSEWQKIEIEAINTLVIPKASYYMDVALLDVTWAKRLDSALRKLVKAALCLPKRTISDFLYVSKRHGGLGLTSLVDTLHTSRIMHALTCLFNPDKRVNNVSWVQLVLTVKSRRQLSEVTTDDIIDSSTIHPSHKREDRGM